jgi:hypothetical protein
VDGTPNVSRNHGRGNGQNCLGERGTLPIFRGDLFQCLIKGIVDRHTDTPSITAGPSRAVAGLQRQRLIAPGPEEADETLRATNESAGLSAAAKPAERTQST